MALFLLTTPFQIDDPNLFNGYLLLGFGVMWLIGLVYMLYVGSQQRNVEQDIALMQQLLQDDDESAES